MEKRRFSGTGGPQYRRDASLGKPQIHLVENGFPLGRRYGIDVGESVIVSVSVAQGRSVIERAASRVLVLVFVFIVLTLFFVLEFCHDCFDGVVVEWFGLS